MKILYLDFLYPKGHIRQNITYISCLSKFATVYVLCPKAYYSALPQNVIVIENDWLKIKDGRLLNRLSTLKIMAISAKLAYKINPDYIFTATYETIIFTFGRVLYDSNWKTFLLQHYNVDELQNKIKRWFFKTYMKKVDHIVFEDFIKDYLIKNFKIDSNRVHVLPHQLNENTIIDNKKEFCCVGLSNTNDERIISEIIDIESKKGILKKSNCKVVLKSKVLEYDNGFLKVVKGYLDDNKYNEYINNSQSIYMPFPVSFCYRMSGTLVDALSNHKVVLASDISLIKYYALKYPEVCNIVYSAEDFFKFVINIKKADINKKSKCFDKFIEEHSDKKIIQSLKEMFK